MAAAAVRKNRAGVPSRGPVYVNDPSRPSVRREIEADTIEKEIHRTSPLQPIGVQEYRQKVKHLRTVINRAGADNTKQGQGESSYRSQSDESSFLNRLVAYFGEHKAALETEPSQVGKHEEGVKCFVESVLTAVACKDPRFEGTLLPCGSFYEGVKVSRPNEFDYIWVLKSPHLSMDQLHFKNVKPDTFKPRKHLDIYGRSYFKMGFRGSAPDEWRCKDCKDEGLPDCLASPRILQEQFRQKVQKVATGVRNDCLDAQVTASGPAVTLFTKLDPTHAEQLLNKRGRKNFHKHKSKIDFFLIKIDITLAVEVRRNHGKNKSWPLEGVGDIELDTEMIGQNVCIDSCHLVMAGDFWRVSFSSWETELMYNLTDTDPNKKRCFQALKYLRDQLALTEDHETALLGTYPLKVTFLKQSGQGLGRSSEQWEQQTLSQRAAHILHKVEQEGSEGNLTSYFIKNDPVLLESDRSYIESRRIQHYLEKMSRVYRMNGLMHTILLGIFMLCHVLIILFSGLYLGDSQVQGDSKTCPLDQRAPILELGQYIFGILPVGYVALIIVVFGFIWGTVNRYIVDTTNVLFEMYFGLILVYAITGLMTLIETFVMLRLAVGFTDGAWFGKECSLPTELVHTLAQVLCAISTVIVLAMLIHMIVFFAKSGRKSCYYSWEIVFFDNWYREIFGVCKMKETGEKYHPPAPSRQISSDMTLDQETGGVRQLDYEDVDVQLHTVVDLLQGSLPPEDQHQPVLKPLPAPKLGYAVPPPLLATRGQQISQDHSLVLPPRNTQLKTQTSPDRSLELPPRSMQPKGQTTIAHTPVLPLHCQNSTDNALQLPPRNTQPKPQTSPQKTLDLPPRNNPPKTRSAVPNNHQPSPQQRAADPAPPGLPMRGNKVKKEDAVELQVLSPSSLKSVVSKPPVLPPRRQQSESDSGMSSYDNSLYSITTEA